MLHSFYAYLTLPGDRSVSRADLHEMLYLMINGIVDKKTDEEISRSLAVLIT